MWPGSRLRVILDSEGRGIKQPQPLHHAVIQVHVRHFSRAELRLETGPTRPAGPSAGWHSVAWHSADRHSADRHSAGWHSDREAMIVTGDLDLAGTPVLHWLVHASVTEAQLVGVETEGEAEYLGA